MNIFHFFLMRATFPAHSSRFGCPNTIVDEYKFRHFAVLYNLLLLHTRRIPNILLTTLFQKIISPSFNARDRVSYPFAI
jgi:hypothetical protein